MHAFYWHDVHGQTVAVAVGYSLNSDSMTWSNNIVSNMYAQVKLMEEQIPMAKQINFNSLQKSYCASAMYCHVVLKWVAAPETAFSLKVATAGPVIKNDALESDTYATYAVKIIRKP